MTVTFKIQLCDETVTSLIDADSYESDELVKAGGFDDGRKWARTLRDLVKRGKVEPTLKSLFRVEDAGDLSPEMTVTAYSLARYMQSTPARLAKFSKSMERVDTSRAVPVAEEMAKILENNRSQKRPLPGRCSLVTLHVFHPLFPPQPPFPPLKPSRSACP